MQPIEVEDPVRVRLQGKTLTLKPNTPANVAAAERYYAEVADEATLAIEALRVAAREAPAAPVAELDLPSVRSPHEINVGLLEIIVSDEDRPKLAAIDFDEVSADALRRIRDAFLPSWQGAPSRPGVQTA